MTSSTDAQPALARFDGPVLDHDLGDGFALVRFEGEPTVVTDPSGRVLSAEQVRAEVALWTRALAAIERTDR